MGKTIYYLKINNKIIKISEEEKNEFLKSLENKEYLCSNCKICDCEKIKYYDIRICDEVNIALLERTLKEFVSQTGRVIHTKDDKIFVYDCKRYEEFNDKKIEEERKIARKIIVISRRINRLKDNLEFRFTEKRNEELIENEKLIEDYFKLLTNESIIKELRQDLKKISDSYQRRKNKELGKTLTLDQK
ncbi:MAG: hypothetical protein IJ105_02690 [Bacilli bacterium]|nr:hypothetical protein [Bacilli bacterium]